MGRGTVPYFIDYYFFSFLKRKSLVMNYLKFLDFCSNINSTQFIGKVEVGTE